MPQSLERFPARQNPSIPLSGCGGWRMPIILALWRLEAGRSGVQGHPYLPSLFKTEYLRPHLQKTTIVLGLDRLIHASQAFIHTSSQPRDPSKNP